MSIKEFYKDLFTFHKHERNGVVVLIVLLVSLGMWRWSLSKGATTRNELSIARKKTEMPMDEKPHKEFGQNRKSSEVAIQEPFDPNALSDDDWKGLGLSEKQIGSIRKFQSKGGKFKSKEDVKKMYMISEKLYAKMENWMTFSEEKKQPTTWKDSTYSYKNTYATKPLPKGLIELNTADTIMLSTLPGIGPFLARKIVQWREKLGGFISQDQLYDVWKITPEKVDAIKSYITIDPNQINRVNINTAEYEQLRKHPYLAGNQASAIVAYRKVHGNYLSVDDLKKVIPIDTETMKKIRPYISVE